MNNKKKIREELEFASLKPRCTTTNEKSKEVVDNLLKGTKPKQKTSDQ